MRKRAVAWAGVVTLGVLVAAGLLGVRARCREASGPLPVAELAAERYRFVTSPASLPWAIQREVGPMVAVGRPFNASDVVMDDSLPWARLIAAAVGSRYAIVQVETGGFGPMWFTAVFRQDGWSGWVTWSSVSSKTFRDQDKFAAAIRSGDIWRAVEQRDATDGPRSR
jgi:hypothetical protein